MQFPIYTAPARSILTRTSGFNAQAGFTHSLTPARNCTFGCSYCYVPTMGIYGGLKPGDAQRWGRETTFKSFPMDLLARALRSDQIIYCSPLVDPFQPAEAEIRAMRPVLETVASHPPRVFVLQTRSCLVLDYLEQLQALSRRTALRVSFSITTDDDAVRRLYEPHCHSIESRFAAVRALTAAGINTFITLAPLLPCDPERLVDLALGAASTPLICDPFHTRHEKPRGGTTRQPAEGISRHHRLEDWHNPGFQKSITERMKHRAEQYGRRFATGPAGFSFLTEFPTQ